MSNIPDNVNLLVADTETTCATPERGVCEVGFAFVHPDGTVYDEYESLIDPQRPISPAASGVHGLTNDDVANAPTLEEFFSADAPGCYGKKIQGPAVVIGHRISFDTHTLAPYIDGEIFELCTLRWARRMYPDADNHQLSTLMFALNLPRPQNAHRVMSDVYSALYLAKHLAERMGTDLLGLARMSQEPFEVVYVPFGKHKGTKFRDVPRSYLRWMRESMTDLDMDVKHTLNLILNKA